MITKYKNLGTALSQNDMKEIKGGAKPPHYWWWDCEPLGGGGSTASYCSDTDPSTSVLCIMQCTQGGVCGVPNWPGPCPF